MIELWGWGWGWEAGRQAGRQVGGLAHHSPAPAEGREWGTSQRRRRFAPLARRP